MRGAQFEFKRDLNKIGKPVDRTRVGHDAADGERLLQSGNERNRFSRGHSAAAVFRSQADDASNYGAMGAVIGHEMTHGFDDEGRKFDAQGNLRDWWTPEDEKNFNERAECVEKQFDGYVVAGDLHENGKLVLGESIADLGGLNIAYRALERRWKGNRAPDRRVYAGPALLPGLRAIWATTPARIGAPAIHHGPAPAGPLPRDRRAIQHAGVRASI